MAVKKPDRPQKPIYKKWWFWVIIALVLAAIGSSVNGGDGKDKAPSSSVAESSSTQESTVTPTVAPTQLTLLVLLKPLVHLPNRQLKNRGGIRF